MQFINSTGLLFTLFQSYGSNKGVFSCSHTDSTFWRRFCDVNDTVWYAMCCCSYEVVFDWFQHLVRIRWFFFIMSWCKILNWNGVCFLLNMWLNCSFPGDCVSGHVCGYPLGSHSLFWLQDKLLWLLQVPHVHPSLRWLSKSGYLGLFPGGELSPFFSFF